MKKLKILGLLLMIAALFCNAASDRKFGYSIQAKSFKTPSIEVSALDVDWNETQLYYKTISADSAFTFSNASDGETVTIAITASGANRTATFPGGVVWTGATPGAITQDATIQVSFMQMDTVIYGALLGTVPTGMTVTSLKTANYDAAANEIVRGNVSGGGFYIRLPDGPEDGTRVIVQNFTLAPTTEILEIQTQGSDVFVTPGGPTSIYTSLLLETIVATYYETDSLWTIIHTSAPSSLAANFPGIDDETPIPASAIGIDKDSRILTVTPPLGYFNVVIRANGKARQFRKDSAVAFPAFTNTSGFWFFYFDTSGTAVTTQTAWTLDDLHGIAPVYRIWWNATEAGDDRVQLEMFETHPNDIPSDTHVWMHLYGSVWAEGLTIASNAATVGAPAADGADTVVALTSGTIVDDNLDLEVTSGTGSALWEQDLGNTTPASLNATNSGIFDVRYMAAGLVEYDAGTRFPFPFNVSDEPQYYDTAGALQDVTNNYYFSVFLYAIGDPRTGKFVSSATSTTDFFTLAGAEAYTWDALKADIPILEDGEIRPLYRLIYEHRGSYSTGAKESALRYVADLRKAMVTSTTVAAGSIPATSVTVTPAGTISSTNVQSALEELDTDIQGAVMDVDFTAADEIMVGTGAGTHNQVTLGASEFLAKKAAGAATNVTAAEARTILNIEDGADVTDATNVDAAGAVMEADFDAQTILAATVDDTPAALTVAEQTLVGRVTGGNVTDLTVAQIRTLLNLQPTEPATISAVEIDWEVSMYRYKTTSADDTYTFANATDGWQVTCAVIASGADRTPTFPAGVEWAGGNAPGAITSGKTLVVTFIQINSVLYGSAVEDME